MAILVTAMSALQARMSKAMRKLSASINKDEDDCDFNQLREKVGVMFGKS